MNPEPPIKNILVGTTGENESTSTDLGKLANVVFDLQTDVKKQKDDIQDTKTLATLGFIIALIMVATMLIMVITYTVTTIIQMNKQTVLLQEIKDKVNH